jgi:carbonic anhydrase
MSIGIILVVALGVLGFGYWQGYRGCDLRHCIASVLHKTHALQLKSPIDLDLPKDLGVKIFYNSPFKGTAKVVCEELPAQDLPKEYMIEVNHVKGEHIRDNYIEVDGTRYFLAQFHLHVPSEHTIRGKRMPGEIHFVNISDKGKIAVFGAFITLGKKPHTAFEGMVQTLPQVFKTMPQHEGEGPHIALKEPVNVAGFLPKKQDFCEAYRYLGSKTSGNLAPEVKWLIATQPIKLSQEQLKALEPIRSTGTKIHPRLDRLLTIIRISIEGAAVGL